MLLFGGISAAEAVENPKKPWGQLNDNWRISGELMGAYENWDYFQPSPAKNNDNDYDLGVVRARLGLEMKTALVDGFVQGQYIGMYGLPSHSVALPGGPLGLGSAYFSGNDDKTAPGNTFLRQAYLNLKGDALGLQGAFLKAGRFEVKDGDEYKTGNAKFDQIKKLRVAQRLLGSNAVHVTRTFDGASAVYDNPAFNFTAHAVRPTQGGFTVQGQDEISDIDVFYAALTGKKDAWLPGTEGRLFYMYYNDDRDTQVVDNRPAKDRPSLQDENLELHTVGGHLLAMQTVGSGSVDGLLWGAYQFGNWTNQRHKGWAIDSEIGYQWNDAPLKPWLRAIYYLSSGDSDSKDNRHDAFYSMLPSGRIFAKFPFYNLMNLQDAFIEMVLSPTPKTRVTVDLHHLSLKESNDLFYGGLGATQRQKTFGFVGRATGDENDLGKLVDVTVSHAFTEELVGRFYYAHAFGGDVIKNFYRGQKDASTFWVDLTLTF